MVVAKRGVWLCLSVLKASPDMLSLPLHSGTGETPRHPFKLTAYWADDAFGRGTAGSAPERVAIPTKHFSYFCAAFTLHVKDFTHALSVRLFFWLFRLLLCGKHCVFPASDL